MTRALDRPLPSVRRRFVAASLAGLFAGLPVVFSVAPSVAPLIGVSVAVVIFLDRGLARGVRKGLLTGLLVGLAAGVVNAIGAALVAGPADGLAQGLRSVLAVGLSLSASWGLAGAILRAAPPRRAGVESPPVRLVRCAALLAGPCETFDSEAWLSHLADASRSERYEHAAGMLAAALRIRCRRLGVDALRALDWVLSTDLRVFAVVLAVVLGLVAPLYAGGGFEAVFGNADNLGAVIGALLFLVKLVRRMRKIDPARPGRHAQPDE